MTQAYRTAAAFKQALEQRLRMASASSVDFARRRQLVVFERFLARVALELGDAVTLKGVKDLPDIAHIASAGPVEAGRVRAAIEQTFAFRGTHDVPMQLPAPPATRAAPYATIAREDRLRWVTLVEAFEAARTFLDPVLAAPGGAIWDPTAWRWTAPAPTPNPEQD